MPGKLEIHLLGHLRVLVGDQPLPFKAPPKTTPLWAYLLLRQGEPVSRQTLAFTLWPDEAERTARTNLRRHIHYLKQALPPTLPDRPWLQMEAETIRWNAAADWWLDVAEFEQLAATAETVAEAVLLYTGDLLEDQYDDWIIYQRERLRSLYIASLNQLIQRFWSQRDYSEAIRYASQLLAYDPLREDGARQLMALRYQAGDRAGALKEYETFVQRLESELGVGPMPETIAAYEAILRDSGLPGPAQATAKPPGLPPQALQLPFVGREVELEALKSWWDEAAGGQGRLVMIAGEAGVGKTRLVEEFARVAESQGGRLLKGLAYPTGSTPYQAILAALRSALPMLSILEVEPIWLAAVAALMPELRARCARQGRPLPQLGSNDPERDRTRLFEGIAICLEALARPRPLVLCLEDLHWAGAGTFALLEWIARRGLPHPLLILVTYRQEEAGRVHPLRDFRRRWQRQALVAHLALEPLSATAVQDLVTQISRMGDAATELAAQLYGDSEGNPLFLLELIRDHLEAGRIQTLDNRWSLVSGQRAAIPKGIRSAIEGRVARLSPPANRLMEIMSVIGATFNIELVSEVSGWRESQVLDSLDELLDQHLVREVASGRFDYTFSHELIRAAIYEALPEAICKRRHHRVAHVLESLISERAEAFAAGLALHFDRGDEPERAAGYYLVAAREALAVYAEEESLAALDRALEIAAGRRLRFDLLALREEIAHRRGDRLAQERDLNSLIGLVEPLNDPDLVCEVLHRRIRRQRTLGERQAEEELVAALKSQAQASGLRYWQAHALQADALYHMAVSQYDAAGQLLEEALTLYRSLNDVGGEATCLCRLAEIGVYQSRFDQAQTLLKEAQAVAGSHGSQTLLVETLRIASAAAFSGYDYQTSLALARQMLEICRATGDREGEADALSRLAVTQARLFQVQVARSHYEQAAALYDALGKRQGQAAVTINAAILATNLGRYDEAIALSGQAEAIFRELNDLRGQTLSALQMSAAAIYRGDFSGARQAAQRCLALVRQIGMPMVEANALGNLGESELNLGQLASAVTHLEEAIALRREQNAPPVESAADLAILIVAHLRNGEAERAYRTAQEALAIYDEHGQALPYPQQVLWAAAQAYQAVGQVERAGELIAQAAAILDEKASAILDVESRTAFLNLPFNREVIKAYRKEV
jgi:DNA-binding SARP family transcriptional activator